MRQEHLADVHECESALLRGGPDYGQLSQALDDYLAARKVLEAAEANLCRRLNEQMSQWGYQMKYIQPALDDIRFGPYATEELRQLARDMC